MSVSTTITLLAQHGRMPFKLGDHQSDELLKIVTLLEETNKFQKFIIAELKKTPD